MRKISGWILVLIQFSCILYLLVNEPLKHLTLFGGLLLACGFLLGCWAVLTMRKSRLRILPDPAKNATLITKGPYHLIRHPMYTSVLLCCATITNFNNRNHLFSYILLLTTLVIKSYFEERMLQQKFADYAEYKKRTFRLLPYIF